MKKNELSVWTYPYKRSYYVLHPWRWFYDVYWNFRNWWHRGKYGFAYVDVWEWGRWWPKVGAEALKHMKEHGSGYPGAEPFETPEKWDAYLTRLINSLEWCSYSQDDETHNEYYEEFRKMCENCRKETDDGIVYEPMNDADKLVRDKYFTREMEIQEKNDKRRADILAEIGKILPRIWD